MLKMTYNLLTKSTLPLRSNPGSATGQMSIKLNFKPFLDEKHKNFNHLLRLSINNKRSDTTERLVA